MSSGHVDLANYLKHLRSGGHGILLQLLQLSNKSLHIELKISLQSTMGSVTHKLLGVGSEQKSD